MRHRIRRALGTLLAAGLLGSGLVALDVPAAQAAYPVPPTPSGLPAAIEVLQPYIGQSTCDPVAKSGVSAFKNLLLRTYTDSGSLGIVRACSAGGQSEHKEGRAFDWAMSAYNTRQKAEVATLLSWLLKTDANGNQYAMARRFDATPGNGARGQRFRPGAGASSLALRPAERGRARGGNECAAKAR